MVDLISFSEQISPHYCPNFFQTIFSTALAVLMFSSGHLLIDVRLCWVPRIGHSISAKEYPVPDNVGLLSVSCRLYSCLSIPVLVVFLVTPLYVGNTPGVPRPSLYPEHLIVLHPTFDYFCPKVESCTFPCWVVSFFLQVISLIYSFEF